jgi:putative Ca2+/H+ antiporter (TMEM165/GDT1 family)
VETILAATGLVALAEMGDKTQLLAFVLAARYRRPLAVILGILVATLLNHGLAAWLGVWLAHWIDPTILRWLLGLSFVAMAAWVLMPDDIEADDPGIPGVGVFWATLAAFFIAEMGDKTQVATVALAAGYAALVPVVIGTTLGMMIANVPAVYLGGSLGPRIPMSVVRGAAATLFVLFGAAVLLGLV